MLALDLLQRCAAAAGFDDCGVAKADCLPEDAEYLSRWTEAGCHGTMQYFERNTDKRTDPRLLVPGCKSLAVCVLSYYKTDRQPQDAPLIARSGLSERDYHEVMKEKLQLMEMLLKREAGDDCVSSTHQHIFCDSAPILERRWAQRAGLGWIGKNRLFVHPTFGSFVFIGILALNAEVDSYATAMNIGCGDCERCLRACPTGAIRGKLFDARKCISYLTIERKEALEDKYKPLVANTLYGCDRCQNVCPYNAALQPLDHAELATDPRFLTMTRADWESLSRRQRIKLLKRQARDE